jgi:hypothetical protein
MTRQAINKTMVFIADILKLSDSHANAPSSQRKK